LLYFVSAELALGYWLFAFLAALGTLQCIAARYRLRGLALLDYAGRPALGYAVGTILGLVGTLAFFVTQWEPIFAPGPAGSELAVLFATSAAAALAVALTTAAITQRLGRSFPAVLDDGGQEIRASHSAGRLYKPPAQATPVPAICLVPGLPASEAPMMELGRRLAEAGLVALVLHRDEESYTYPAVLAVLPAALAALKEHPEVDAERMGVVGDDLAADLVIRAASTGKEIRAVAAVAPILTPVPAGLDLLREMSFFRAMRWARDQKRATLCRELNAMEYGARIPPRPFLLLYGGEDRLVGDPALSTWQAQQPNTVEMRFVPGVGHFGLLSHAPATEALITWLKEHM